MVLLIVQILIELHGYMLPLRNQQYPGTRAETLEWFFARMWCVPHIADGRTS